MNIVIILLTISFIAFIGYAVIRLLDLLPKKMVLFTIGCSWGLGAGLVALQLYFYSRLNILWSREFLILPWMFLILIFLFKNTRKIPFKFPNLKKFRLAEIILISLIATTATYVFLEAIIRPVMAWDAWAIWLLKAKIFFIDGRINPEVLNYVKSDYPLIISLLNTFIYLILGRVDDSGVLLTSFAFYIFLSLALFSVLREKIGLTYALLFTFLFMTIQTFVRQGGRLEAGQADLPLGYYIFICVMLLVEYFKNNSVKSLLLLNIFLGITVLIKPEGLFTVLVISSLAIFSIYKKRAYHHVKFFSIWVILFFDWEIYKRLIHLKYTYISAHPIELSWEKTFNAIYSTLKELINIKSWNLLWITYFLSIIARFKNNNELIILNTIILSQLGVYMFMYIFTSGNSPESSIERLLVHIAPLVLYYISILIHQLYGNFNTKHILSKVFRSILG